MYPNLFGISFIHMYGLCIAIGILVCFYVLEYCGKKRNIDSKFVNFVEINGIIAIVLGFGSAMLFQSFYNWLDDTSQPFKLTESFTFMGGLIGGVAVFLIGYFAFGRRRYGAHIMELLPIAPGCIVIAHAFGRIGCFCWGCCYGEATDSIWGMVFPNPELHLTHAVYPTQLYEAIFLFLLFGLLFWLLIKKKFIYTFPIYLLAYGAFRFAIEYIRGDHRGTFIGGMSPSQFWAVAMMVIAVPLYFFFKWYYKKFPINIETKKEEVLEAGEVFEDNELN